MAHGYHLYILETENKISWFYYEIVTNRTKYTATFSSIVHTYPNFIPKFNGQNQRFIFSVSAAMQWTCLVRQFLCCRYCCWHNSYLTHCALKNCLYGFIITLRQITICNSTDNYINSIFHFMYYCNPLRTKHIPFYLKNQFIPSSKHLWSQLTITECCIGQYMLFVPSSMQNI